MALWHDFAWELNDASGMELSNAANVAISSGVLMTRHYSKGLKHCIVFSSRQTLASAVSVARTYISRKYDTHSVLESSDEYEVRGYFTMSYTD